MSLNAQWYEGLTGLRQLRTDWYGLTPGAQLFARYEWHLAATTHLVGDDHTIWFCRIADNAGRPLSIIPAVKSSAVIKPFGEVPALALGWSDQLSAFDFPLAHGANTLEVGKAMLKAFSDLPCDWRVISWRRVMADSNAARIARSLGHGITDMAPSSVCDTFCTASTPDPAAGHEVFTVKSPKLRKILAQRSRRLGQRGPVQMRMGREQHDLEGFFQEFLRIESGGWKGAKGTGTALALVPAAREFYHSMLAESSADFETDIALLYCGDQAVAGQLLMRAARWEHVCKIGYDEAFANCSPGQLLMQLVIEHAKTSDAIDRVSLVTGYQWMNDWAPIPVPTLRINIFQHLWLPSAVRLGRYVLAGLRTARSSVRKQRTGTGASPGEAPSEQTDSHWEAVHSG